MSFKDSLMNGKTIFLLWLVLDGLNCNFCSKIFKIFGEKKNVLKYSFVYYQVSL